MALQITKRRIGLAIMKNSEQNLIEKLNPINYQAKQASVKRTNNRDKEEIRKELLHIAKAENVCGIVVGWPLEPSGLPGSRCGQVLHLLDHFAETRHEGGYLINQRTRPVVLLDERMFTHGQFDENKYPMDEWGRSQVFGKKSALLSSCENEVENNEKIYSFKTSLRSDHPASDDSTAASLILEEFMKKHQNVLGTNKLQETMKIIERNIEQESENIVGEMKLQQIIESFDQSQQNMKSLPL